MQDQLDRHETVIGGMREMVARIDERTKLLLEMVEAGDKKRESLEERIAPLADAVMRWKGGLAVIAIISGAVGALLLAAFRRIFHIDP